MSDKGIIVIYNTESNGTKVEVKLIDGNLWLTQEQIVSLYNSSKSNISEHIKHILEEGELTLEATVRKFRTVQKEGEREVGRNIAYYNLGMILAIGSDDRKIRLKQLVDLYQSRKSELFSKRKRHR